MRRPPCGGTATHGTQRQRGTRRRHPRPGRTSETTWRASEADLRRARPGQPRPHGDTEQIAVAWRVGRGGAGHEAARFSGCRRGSVSGPGDSDPHTHVREESGHQLPPAGQRRCAMTLQMGGAVSGAGTGPDGRGCQDAELAFGRPVARPDAAERRARKQSGRQTACGAHVANRTLIVPSQVSVYVGRQDFGGSSYHYANFT